MRGLSLLIKPASGNCNLRCSYCFYHDEMGSRKVANRGMMNLETIETIIAKALGETEEVCSIGFQGGEPTLIGLDFYKEVIELEKKYNINKVRIVNTLQTNGMTIDDEWARFFNENDFLIGLSIDGCKDVHDNFRLRPSGKGTFNACIKAAGILRRNKTEFNILSVVTKQLAAHPDQIWNFYKKNDFRYIQFIPCLDKLDQAPGSNGFSLNEKTYGKFLCRIFDLWHRDFEQDNYYSVRAFDNYIHMLMGAPPESCSMSGRCAAYLLIEADGAVYPCDFYALDNYKIGDVNTGSFTDMLESDVAKSFIKESVAVAEECNGCNYYFICRAGCRRDREPLIEGKPPQNRYCGAYKEFFGHALPRMKAVARSMSQRQARGY